MLFDTRQRRFIRQLRNMGCSKERATEIGKLQREVWDREDAVEDARVILRVAIRKALDAEPAFDAGLQARRQKAQES